MGTQPSWHWRNLSTHYYDHPGGRDRDCWADLIGKSAPVPKEDYKQASLDAWNHCICSARHVNQTKGQPPKSFWDPPSKEWCISRFDAKGIRVIAVETSERIKTCYHLHQPTHLHPNDIYPAQLRQMIKSRLRAEGVPERDITWQP